MSLGFGERFILLKACIVRRTPRSSWIQSEALLKAIQEDIELVRSRTPEYYFCDGWITLGQELADVVAEGLITGSSKFQRTGLGDIFLQSLEPKLASTLDEMPMTGEGVLDFLSLL